LLVTNKIERFLAGQIQIHGNLTEFSALECALRIDSAETDAMPNKETERVLVENFIVAAMIKIPIFDL